jgi:transposase-like protein
MSKHTTEQKNKFVKYALQASSLSSAAKELNIPTSTLHAWVREHRLLRQGNSISSKADINIKKELTKKNKEIRKLKEELEILKKFKAFSVKTPS